MLSALPTANFEAALGAYCSFGAFSSSGTLVQGWICSEGMLGQDVRRLIMRDGVAMASLCVAIYSATQFPTVPGGDSGELIVAACSLGIPHPPGYPTHTVQLSVARQC